MNALSCYGTAPKKIEASDTHSQGDRPSVFSTQLECERNCKLPTNELRSLPQSEEEKQAKQRLFAQDVKRPTTGLWQIQFGQFGISNIVFGDFESPNVLDDLVEKAPKHQTLCVSDEEFVAPAICLRGTTKQIY